MSIFKRLFGNSKDNKKNSGHGKPDIEKLLSSENINNSIIEMDNYVCKICAWGDEIEKLTEEQKYFYFNQELEREVNNGGFNQYFLNSSGDYSHETVKSLLAIKAYKTVELLQKAIDQFPDKKVPNNRERRLEIVGQIEERANPIWEQLDQTFFEYADNLNALNMEFIRQHRDNFI